MIFSIFERGIITYFKFVQVSNYFKFHEKSILSWLIRYNFGPV